MAKPLISVVGNVGTYDNPTAILNKLTWNSPASFEDPAFKVEDRLDETNGMPVIAAVEETLAPYVFSFLNKKANEPQFRVALTNYHYDDFGKPGNSNVWMYDPTGTGWVNKPKPGGGDAFFAFNPPANFYALANIDFEDNNYLVAGDYDSPGMAGGTLCLLSMDATESYATVVAETADFAQKAGGYVAHVQDVHVQGERIFVLVIFSKISGSGSATTYDYAKSEVREYKLGKSASSIVFQRVDTVEISKNAVSLTYHEVGGTAYLFVPCIGGMQKFGSGNGQNSSISLVKVESAGGFDKTAGFENNGEMRALVGVDGSVAYHDFRSIAIASDGHVYFLCGDYTSDRNGLTFEVYDTTADHLVSNGTNGDTSGGQAVPYTIATDFDLPMYEYIQTQTATSAFFWALGICKGPDGSEHLIFAKGSVYAPMDYVGHDVISFVPVGEPWIDSHTIGHYETGDEINAFTGKANSRGFAINSIDISVPGGETIRLRAAAPPAGAGRASGFGAKGTMLDELRKGAKKVAATYKL